MNRLSSSVILKESNTNPSDCRDTESLFGEKQTCDSLLAGLCTSADQADTCSVFTPLHYEPDYAYPLLIWLHGKGQNENQLRHVMPKISMRNYAAVAPRGPSSVGQACFGELDDAFSWSLKDAHISQAIDSVCAAIEQAGTRFHIDPDRIFLVGSGSGGTMALQIGMTLPERFCGIISLGGSLPQLGTPLSHLTASRRLPLLLSVDRDNKEYPDALVCQDLRLLHIAGMTITLRQYPAGNALSDSMLADIDQWIMEAITDQQQAPIVSC